MSETATLSRPTQTTEHFDVLIVGAGISGIGAAYHLTRQCPEKTFVVLETQASFGGTWLTHRYPGIRSDSDLHTFGYRFKPWTSAPIATAAEIRSYMNEVIQENDLATHIRYQHKIRIVHPQTWPDDLDCTGKTVVVIGSGATAATVVPAIANDCAHVTMLQRSPTYFRTGRNAIALAEELRALHIQEEWIHEIVRKKILYEQDVFTRRSFTEPEKVKQELLAAVRAELGSDYDVETHFTPSYRPWRQRIAFVPDADLFKGIASGKASVVTDEIERFTETGLQLKSGRTLPADIIITATGFHLNALGDIAFTIDDKALAFSDTVTYRGMMFTGVPNMAWVFGYFRASWTLRADLVGDFVCRLLNHMQAKGVSRVMPALRPEDKDMQRLPWIDAENFNPGYITRGIHLLPKRGDKPEWQHTQDYWAEKDEFPAIDLDDAVFAYG
jgi:cation diffusion facilitator CzcD-associated flavoprotein CzcO